MIARTLIGCFLAVVVSLLARRANALSTSGAVAAAVVGGASAAAGWGWAVLLIAYFVASVLLSRAGEAAKAARTAGGSR